MTPKMIFQNLLFNDAYSRKVIPYLKPEYFDQRSEQHLITTILEYVGTYKNIPTVETVEVELASKSGITQNDFTSIETLLSEIKQPFVTPDIQWLTDQTEEFCIAQSCYKSVVRSISILNNEDDLPRSAIPELLRDALSVSFDCNVGHDYALNAADRYQKLHEQTARIKTDIRDINDAYGGGIPRKTLSVFLAQTGGGKSLVKSHLAAHFYKQGYNVLYVTLELSEERIGERLDANMFGIDVVDIPAIPLETYTAKVEKIAKNTNGRLFIKEYPPASITASHLRSLIEELKLKQDFVPDVVIVDYLNLMVSSRYKAGSNNNSYTIIKAIAEELRSIAVEYNAAVISSSQLNRAGFGNSDVDITNTSESIGLPSTCDALFAIIRTEELDEMHQIMIKVLKTRFSDKTNHRFLCGISLNQMRITEAGAADQAKVSQVIKPEDYNKPSTQSGRPEKKKVKIQV